MFDIVRFAPGLGFYLVSGLFLKRLPFQRINLIGYFDKIDSRIHAKDKRAALVPLVKVPGQAKVRVTSQLNFFKVVANQLKAFINPGGRVQMRRRIGGPIYDVKGFTGVVQ